MGNSCPNPFLILSRLAVFIFLQTWKCIEGNTCEMLHGLIGFIGFVGFILLTTFIDGDRELHTLL